MAKKKGSTNSGPLWYQDGGQPFGKPGYDNSLMWSPIPTLPPGPSEGISKNKTQRDLFNPLYYGFQGANLAANYISNYDEEQRNRRYIMDRRNSDSLFMASPKDKGTYVDTGMAYGMHNPYATGAKSPFGMQGGGYISRELHSPSYIPPAFTPMTLPQIGEAVSSSGLEETYVDVKPTTVHNRAKKAYEYYLSKGLEPKIAAGIVGNLVVESDNFNPDVVSGKKRGDNNRSVGVAQWNGGRYQGLIDYAKKKGTSPFDLYTQLDYVIDEPGEGERVLKAMKKAVNASQAAKIFGKVYERPNDALANWEKRMSVAHTLNLKLEGGQIMDYKKYGGQKNYALDLNTRNAFFNGPEESENLEYRDVLQPVDRSEANVEAEKGETAYGDFDGDGMLEHAKIGGKKHSQGGTPLDLPDQTFIFSDAKKLKFKGPVNKLFGKSENKSYTPAELAKQYDIQKYKKILDNPYSNNMEKKTAELMLQNYHTKLGQLAMVQESKKGFPQGLPEIATMSFGGFVPKAQDGMEINFNGKKIKAKLAEDDYLKTTGAKYLGVHDGKKLYVIPGANGAVNYVANIPAANPSSKLATGEKYLKDLAKQGLDKFSSAELIAKKYGVAGNPLWKTWDSNYYKPQGINAGYKIDDKYFYNGSEDPASIPGDPIAPGPEFPKLGYPEPQPFGPTPGSFNPSGKKVPYDWLTPDKVRMGNALGQWASIKKERPLLSTMKSVTPEPMFYDPRTALAANASAANDQTYYNSMFGNAQSQRARNSSVQAASSQNAANIIGDYDNRNVSVYNQFAPVTADIINKQNAFNADAWQKYTAENAITNSKFRRERNLASNNATQVFGEAWNNASKLNLINNTNEYFYIDPATGKFVQRTGLSLQKSRGSGSTDTRAAWEAEYQRLKNMGMEDSTARERANMALGIGRVNAVDPYSMMRATGQAYLQNMNFPYGNPYQE